VTAQPRNLRPLPPGTVPPAENRSPLITVRQPVDCGTELRADVFGEDFVAEPAHMARRVV
jgi:hypothetical protein